VQVPVAQLWHALVQPVLQHLPSLQLPLAHCVFKEQFWPLSSRHAALALQVLLPVHSGLSSADTTLVQVPVVHVWQVLLQAVLQHLPSLQLPLAHSVLAEQFWAMSLRQLPAALHVLLPMHSGLSSVLVTVTQSPSALPQL